METYKFLTLPNKIESLKKLSQKLNKKATKHGAEAMKVSFGKPRLVEKKVPGDGFDAFWDTRSGMKLKTRKYEVVDVTVEYTPIVVPGGWKILGTVERVAGSDWNLIHGMVDNIGDLKQYDMEFCDHCGYKRKRKFVFVLENSKGERKVVGRQCVKEYIGISISDAIFAADFDAWINKMFVASQEVFNDDGDDQWGPEFANQMNIKIGTDIRDLAVATVYVLRKDHWTYKSKNHTTYEEESTPSVVGWVLNQIKHKELEMDKVFNDENMKEAIELLDELKSEFPEDRIATLDNSFEYDLAVMLHCGHAPRESYFVGMFGYRLASKKKANDDEKKDRSKSEYVGSVGEKMKGVEVEIEKARSVDSFYGESLMVTGFFKGTNNQFVTFMSGNTDWLYDQNADLIREAVVSFTVKKHQDRGYGKQTSVGRFRLAK